MSNIATELVRLAKEILVDTVITFKKTPELEAEDSDYRFMHAELQRLADRIRKNESLETFITRRDTAESVVIGIGFSSHEAKKAILDEFISLASKEAKKRGLGTISVESEG